ncbi:MAG: ribbon-helix-helix domain-containing protein, partial [Alphaproteobacteria bacterium]
MPTSVRLDDETERRLGELARRTGRTKTWYIREAIKEYLDEWDEYYLALSQIEERKGEVDIAELRRRLGLE